MNTQPQVTDLKFKRKSRLLQVSFNNGETFHLSCEFLRVYSPSAEVHGHGNSVLVSHKKNVSINKIEPVGNYGVKLIFDDGHDTGIYSWKLLYQMASQYEQMWQDYLARLRAEKSSREPLIDINIQYRS